MTNTFHDRTLGVTRRGFVQGIGSLGLAATLRAQTDAGVPEQPEGFFLAAKPVWPAGQELEMNLFAGFRAVFTCGRETAAVLRVAASTVYRASLNGVFCGYGPARAGHGHYRVDEWDLGDFLRPGKNLLAIEAAGYNVNSYYLLDQPSFLQAEVASAGKVLAATGGAGTPFEAKILPERVRRVQRYSFQRPFSEVYRLEPGYDAWRTDAAARRPDAECGALPARKLLPRHVPTPRFDLRQPVWVVAEGRVEAGLKPEKLWKDRSLTAIGPELKGFPESQLEVIPSIEIQTIKTLPGGTEKKIYAENQPLRLERSSYTILDLGTNLTGFIGTRITCREPVRLFLTFDEILTDGDVDFKRLGCVNAILFETAAGTYPVEAFEPYTLRYLKLMALEGACTVEGIYLREYANPHVQEAHFAASDERLNRLFAAGRETYRQNAVDLFTDCPSRERAGWLCDSYFTARVARLLSGETAEERNFLENFLVADRFAHLPQGMLPMCYPADHYNGDFIPQWALWFILQLGEYAQRSGDRELVEALRPRVLGVLDYFRPFKNEDGLLEKLPGWLFVEWSAANDFVQDVNYPTNMLYAAALETTGRLYGLPQLGEEAGKIRAVIRRQSFDGAFFVDNAVRQGGKLQVTQNKSEVCQYFAFYFGIADSEKYPGFWRTLRDDFGPHRDETKTFPDVRKANAFIGNVLRLEMLSRMGLQQQLLDESVSYLLYMAKRTGTLWENVGVTGSCDHAFASHIVNVLYRDVLGLHEIDTVHKAVRVRFPDVNLSWCEGSVPVSDGRITLAWRQEGPKKLYRFAAPAGYQTVIEHNDGTWEQE